jgi:DNA-binding transcriptional regulator/RsmH inhibitor MraZ
MPQNVRTYSNLKKNTVACRAITRQQLWDKQIYQRSYWATYFANKTHSHGNSMSNVSTATNQHTILEVMLETEIVHAEEL